MSQRIVLHRGQDVLDRVDLRIGKWQTNHNPDLQTFTSSGKREFWFGHQVLLKQSDDVTNDYRLFVLGGTWDNNYGALRRVQRFNPTWGQSSLPDMKEPRCFFGAAIIKNKLFAFGGHRSSSYEVLDLDDLQNGWVLSPMPPNHRGYNGHDMARCDAVAVENQFIYVLSTYQNPASCFLRSFDTDSGTWGEKDLTGRGDRFGTSMTSVVIPGEGAYVVFLGGFDRSLQLVRSVEAYHLESEKWFHLPDLPDGTPGRWNCTVSSLGNRYILIAGGLDPRTSITYSSVIALDWKTKEWIELPSLPECRDSGVGVMVGGSCNKWIITGGKPEKHAFVLTMSLDIAIGIGWEKEKLLLLCFQKKAQKDKSKGKGPCLLEGLDYGIFAKILQYLFAPFQNEINCKGSIFAGILQTESSSNKKRKDVDSSSMSNEVPKKPKAFL